MSYIFPKIDYYDLLVYEIITTFFIYHMTTKKEKRIYGQFRKIFNKKRYMMMQYSVYCKIFPNRDAAVEHVTILRKNVPNAGQIRLFMVTEKQYSKIEIIVGGKSNQEKIINSESFIKL